MEAPERREDKTLRVVFAGTPAFARVHLEALLASHHEVIGVYTQPDRASGRGKKLTASPVKTLALEKGLPLLQPASLKDSDEQASLAALGADIMVVVAYGLLLPQAILDIPPRGCINVHASLLPRWRGAAPIERALEAGDEQSGVTIMQMDAGLDTGNILAATSCDISAETTGDTLRQQLSELGSAALIETLDAIASDSLLPVPQDDSLSCYAPKLDKREASIDWSQDAGTIARKIRAFCSARVVHGILSGQRIKIWMATAKPGQHQQLPGTILKVDKEAIEVACGAGVLQIKQLQLPGRKVLDVAAVLNAKRDLFKTGTRFNDHE